MSKTFDPYYKWLGIPPNEQPASYYRLLGIPEFENDPQIIESAADRQMTYIKTFQTSVYSVESQKILNELAAARACLLDPVRKSAYDAQLRAVRHGGAIPEFPPSDASEWPLASPVGGPHISADSSVLQRVRRRSSPIGNLAALGIAAILLLGGLMVFFSIRPPSSGQSAENFAKEKSSTIPNEKPPSEPVRNSSLSHKEWPEHSEPAGPSGQSRPSIPTPSPLLKESSRILEKEVPREAKRSPSDRLALPSTRPSEEKEPGANPTASLLLPPQLLSPPTNEEIQRLKKELGTLFAVRNVETPAQAKATAERILQALADPAISPGERYVLRILAGEMFIQANLAGKMWEQWTELATTYDCDGQTLLETMFQEAPPGALFVTKAAVLAGSYWEQVYKKSRFPAVVGSLRALRTAAQQKQAVAALECLKAAEKTLGEFDPFWKAYKTAPEGEKRRAWAEWVCFGMGNWDEGLLLLKEHPDQKLQELAKAELEEKSPDGACLAAIAERWAKYVDSLSPGPKRKAILAHVQALYEQALHPLHAGKLSSLEKVRLEQRLASVKKDSLPPFGPTLTANLAGGGSLKGKWIELLPLIDLPHAVTRGTAEFKKGSLLLPLRSHVQLPISSSGNYELVVNFSRVSGNDSFGVGLPVGSRSIQAVLSFWYGRIDGLHPIDNQPADKNPSGRKGAVIKHNVPHLWSIKVQVNDERCRVAFLLNNKPITEWEGPLSSLSSNTTVLDIGNWDSSQIIHSIRFRAADDQAMLRFTEP